jgi:hypothetical protein
LGLSKRGKLRPQKADVALQTLYLPAQLLRGVLVAAPDGKDNNGENYEEKDFHTNDCAEL